MPVYCVLNRSVLLVVPKQPFYEWKNALPSKYRKAYLDKTRRYNSYLVGDSIPEKELEAELKPYWSRIFLTELQIRTHPETIFPEMSWELFVKWFDVRFSDYVYDLREDDPLDHRYYIDF